MSGDWLITQLDDHAFAARPTPSGFGTGALGMPLGYRGPELRSVHDVECVAEGLIESSSGDLVEVADRFVIEIDLRHGDHVVAADDTRLGKSVLGSEFHF